MNTLERFEHFKEYDKQKKIQKKVIDKKYEILVHACKTVIPDTVKDRLRQDVMKAEEDLTAITTEEMQEGQELEQILNDHVPDDRIRHILSQHYLQKIQLKDVAKELNLSYSYLLKLSDSGKELLQKVVITDDK